jgi:hypothetical protein
MFYIHIIKPSKTHGIHISFATADGAVMGFYPSSTYLHECAGSPGDHGDHHAESPSNRRIRSVEHDHQVIQDPSVHIVYYGWTSDAKRILIDDFVGSLSLSSWWKVNKLRGAPDTLRFVGSTVIVPESSQPKEMNTVGSLYPAYSIIQDAINVGRISPDSTGNTGMCPYLQHTVNMHSSLKPPVSVWQVASGKWY